MSDFKLFQAHCAGFTEKKVHIYQNIVYCKKVELPMITPLKPTESWQDYLE